MKIPDEIYDEVVNDALQLSVAILNGIYKGSADIALERPKKEYDLAYLPDLFIYKCVSTPIYLDSIGIITLKCDCKWNSFHYSGQAPAGYYFIEFQKERVHQWVTTMEEKLNLVFKTEVVTGHHVDSQLLVINQTTGDVTYIDLDGKKHQHRFKIGTNCFQLLLLLATQRSAANKADRVFTYEEIIDEGVLNHSHRDGVHNPPNRRVQITLDGIKKKLSSNPFYHGNGCRLNCAARII